LEVCLTVLLTDIGTLRNFKNFDPLNSILAGRDDIG